MDKRSKDIEVFKESISEYRFSDENSFFCDPHQSSVPYLDGAEKDLEQIFLKSEDLSLNSQDLKQHIVDRKTRYNLTYLRCNFLTALESLFNKKGSVLEIGSGSGTITRWFGENFSSVDAFEGSPARAKITRLRCKDLKNVTVFCGDVAKTRFEKKYTLISLIGVLEYLPLYNTDDNDPKKKCVEILSELSNNLDQNGFLVIAIENKFGT
jgi:SAM-dependent methyltransferase